MPDTAYAADLQLALDLADAADRISLERYRAADLRVSLKADRTHVTDADRAVEAEIKKRLQDARPGDSFFGEESAADEAGEAGVANAAGAAGAASAHGPATGRQWIVDPIDGTANFMRGVPVWATLIALAVDGEPVVGVVSAPALGRRWWAAQGGGAHASDAGFGAEVTLRILGVSSVGSLAEASLSYNGLQYWIEAGRGDRLLDLAGHVWRTRAYGDFWSYMLVAEGAVDIAGEPDLQPYDMAALVPIVREAGGTFSSLDGHPDIWHGSGLATNGRLHESTLSVLSPE